MKKSKTKRNIIIAVTAVVLIAAVFVVPHLFSKDKEQKITTAVITSGSISNTIEGSGVVMAINQYEVTSLVRGEIIADYFEEGDIVEKGQLMYKIDSKDLNSNIEKANVSLERTRLQHNDNVDTIGNLTVTSPISGVISTMHVKNGDTISNGTKIADIIDNDKMLLKITFITDQARELYVGQSATVTLENSFTTTLYGSVSAIATGSMINADGVEVTSVEITVDNPGSIRPDERATAVVGGYACNDAGTFEHNTEHTIVAKAGGEVYGLNYKTGDKISSGSVILKLDSSSASTSLRQSELNIRDSQLSISNLYDQLDNYNITAPISGKVIQKNIKASENLDNTNAQMSMAIIADLSTLIFNMNVDELDVGTIKVGQEVSVTADALPGRLFTGYVDNVSIVGRSENGVTTYPVKVVLNEGEEDGLIPGLNINARVVVQQVDNVVRLPVSAVRRGRIVIVKDDGSGMSELAEDIEENNFINKGDVPDGFVAITVETGISDGMFIEAKGKLREGWEILIPEFQMSSGNPLANMGGGMPGGGMPPGGGQTMIVQQGSTGGGVRMQSSGGNQMMVR